MTHDPLQPGYRTTEFWLIAVGLIVVLVAGLVVDGGVVSYRVDGDLLKWWLLASGGYSVSRGMVKSRPNGSVS